MRVVVCYRRDKVMTRHLSCVFTYPDRGLSEKGKGGGGVGIAKSYNLQLGEPGSVDKILASMAGSDFLQWWLICKCSLALFKLK